MHPVPHSARVASGPARAWTNERQWEAECAGKDKYTSLAAAEATLADLKRHAQRRKVCWLTSYQCGFCGGWHLGNTRRIR